MPGRFPLTRIVPWSHQLLAEVLGEGDLAVDLTAGNGHDTLFLYRCVGARGTVLAFDVQDEALQNTACRFRVEGIPVQMIETGMAPASPGVFLAQASHVHLDACLARSPRGIIANLGYLPGGNPSLTTRPASTLLALRIAMASLAPGGRIAVVAYPGHEGGSEEAQGVEELFRSLPPDTWQVLRVGVPNREGVPFLLVAER